MLIIVRQYKTRFQPQAPTSVGETRMQVIAKRLQDSEGKKALWISDQAMGSAGNGAPPRRAQAA